MQTRHHTEMAIIYVANKDLLTPLEYYTSAFPSPSKTSFSSRRIRHRGSCHQSSAKRSSSLSEMAIEIRPDRSNNLF
ncbi:hypothetical protein HanXRQr2_Chr16g0765221 [Helianthus annuus]|uniref:Uncharacterized protein n=1 Tax=Helianthus annuus TaxID=4232 RepID=A0A9K3DVE4_HELAN|nr:hypothetical protein HanXRQr2_Chr16g0765221 [Helianthus annuus]KAJ0822550.1 hypothetical protein HanPSC8_Chr16g0733391 [Helianthus annuus]